MHPQLVIDHTIHKQLMMAKDDPVTEVSSNASDAEAADGTEQKFDPSNINISILTPTGVVVNLGPQPTSDSVIGIKHYLNTVLETCIYTSYEFEYVREMDVVIINDYTELCMYFPTDRENPSEKVTLRMVSAPYDVKAARAQVRRTADIVQFPPTKRASGIATQSSEVQPINISAEKVAAAADQLPSLDVVFGEKACLNKFYEDTLHQFVTPSPTTANALPLNVVSIACSGWNPPPPGRKTSGDLLYVEVVVANHESFHVTATHAGFYVNKSTRSTFDPTCLQETPCFSHELMTTICQYCPSVKAAWQGFITASPIQKKSSDGLEDLAEFSNLVALHEAGKDEHITITPSWIYLPPSPSMLSDLGGSKRLVDNGLSFPFPHKYDLLRAQEDAANTFGSEVFSPPREWNEEIQAIRAMPVVTPQDKLTCLKYSQKIISEFIDVCKSAAVAVVEGHIQPVNPNEIKDNHVYIFNNIFFSKAMESKESFKLCEGNEASRKYAGLDLKNQRLIQSVNIQGLNTVLTAIVDFKGDRIVAQTVVPGILTPGERSARLLYGCLEHQKPISCKEVALSVLSEAASKLHLAKRNVKKYQALGAVSNKPASNEGDTQSIRIDEEGEFETSPDLDGAIIPHIGPIEGKIIEGSDGRKYILEFMRLMPRDPNYVKGEKGTKLINDEVLDAAGEPLCKCYLLRHELLQYYMQRELIERQKLIVYEAAMKSASTDTSEEEKMPVQMTPELTEKLKALKEEVLSLVVNPNVFMHQNLAADVNPEIEKKDEEFARTLSKFLVQTILPSMTDQIRSADITISDGENLISHIHSCGVNVRYLGRLADLANEQELEDLAVQRSGRQRQNSMPSYWLELLEIEIVSRSVKHMLNKYLNENPGIKVSPANTIATLLSFLLGLPKDSKLVALEAGDKINIEISNGKKSKSASKNGGILTLDILPAGLTNRGVFFKGLKQEVFRRFGYDLKLLRSGVKVEATRPLEVEDCDLVFSERIPRLSLLRRICQLTGVRVAPLDYNIDTHTTEAASVALASSPPTKFSPSSFSVPFRACDILEIVARIKSCEPENPVPDARDIMNNSRIQLQNGNVEAAIELAQEATHWIQQVTNGFHKEMLLAYDLLVSATMNCGDLITAISLCGRSLLTAVQCTGFDSYHTLQAHINLSAILCEIGEFPLAMKHLRASRYIALVMCGSNHPEMLGIIIRIAGIYKSIGRNVEAIFCLTECHQRLSIGGDQVKHANILENLAQIYHAVGSDREAFQMQSVALSLIQQLFGEEHEKTQETKTQLAAYKRSSLEKSVAAARKKMEDEEVEKQRSWLDDEVVTSNGYLHKTGVAGHSKGSKKKTGKKK